MTQFFFFFRSALLALLLTACAAQVMHAPSVFTSSSAGLESPKTLAQAVEVQLDTGYTRPLKAGSQWTLVGVVSQGDVYKPHKDVFTLEGAHVHEAYLVIAGGQLVGFYLPFERSFSSLAQKVRLNFN